MLPRQTGGSAPLGDWRVADVVTDSIERFREVPLALECFYGRDLLFGQETSPNVGDADGVPDPPEARPDGSNVWQGRVDQKVFLGEAIDFQVKVGPRTLLSRRHPTLRTKVGEAIFVQLDPEKRVVLRVA